MAGVVCCAGARAHKCMVTWVGAMCKRAAAWAEVCAHCATSSERTAMVQVGVLGHVVRGRADPHLFLFVAKALKAQLL